MFDDGYCLAVVNRVSEKRRVSVYIDGFNLYNGLKAKGWSRYRWLDIRALSERMVFPDQRLVAVHYFTSRLQHEPESFQRQGIYLDALRLRGGVTIHEGRFEKRESECPACHNKIKRPQEKETDVRMAVQMVLDAVDDTFDVALTVSADSDLVPVVETLQGRFRKDVVVVHPPRRHSSKLVEVAKHEAFISRSWFNQAQFDDPLTLTKPNGKTRTFHRPANWA